MAEREPFIYWVAHRVLHTADPEDPWIRLQRRSLAAQLRLLMGGEPQRVLDLGAGDGGVGDELLDLLPGSAALVLADLRAPSRPPHGRAAWVRADASRLPFADRSFDAIVLKDVLHHVRDRDAVLAEVLRVLTPGGVCVVVEANSENLVMGFIGRHADHAHVSAPELDTLLKRHARIERAATFNAYPFYGFVFFSSLPWGPIWNLGIFAQLMAFKLLPPLARHAAGRVGSRQAVRHPSFLLRRLAAADRPLLGPL
jgi:ubiquinone/menaquinone biosynthesis C-methylase UbiE